MTEVYTYENSRGFTYYLYVKECTLLNRRQISVYYFAKRLREGALTKIPAGYRVTESMNGLPVLKVYHGKEN